MPEFDVEVKRVAWGFRTIRVEAANEAEAEEAALSKAGDLIFLEKGSEYEVDLVEEVE